MDIPPFGKIDSSELEDYYDGEISVMGNKTEVDLNFESESIDESKLIELNKYLGTIDTLSNKAFVAISEDWDLDDDSETARFYFQHHLEELDEEEIKSIFGNTEVDKSLFMKALHLVRIGFCPEDDDSYAIFDIQLPAEYTNYLMAVTFKSNGDLSYISMDS